jgi:hypothetical protein
MVRFYGFPTMEGHAYVNFQLHHHLLNFEVPVVVNFEYIFELFELFDLETIGVN